eukprot:51017_1
MEQEQQLIQVQKFLSHEQTHVRLGAIEIISGCSLQSQLHPFFTKLNVGKQLLNLINDNNEDILNHSCISLVNLTSNPNFSLNLLKLNPFDGIMKQLRSKYIKDKNKELLIKTMVNITQIENGISQLLQENTSVKGLNVIRLIHMLKNIDIKNEKQLETYHYLPFLLCNVTKGLIGRELIMEPQRNLIKYVINFMDYSYYYSYYQNNKKFFEYYQIFYKGIWNIIKNCIFLLNDESKLQNYYSKIFLDCSEKQEEKQEEWTKNHLIFEIINPIIGSFCEYKKTVRNKILKKQKQNKSIDILLKYMNF